MTEAPSLPPAYRLVTMDTVGSTNEEAKRLARAGAEDGTLVWAREQTAGRGRSGRSWTSPPGNLYCSIIARPECPPAEAAQLSFVAALGLGGALGAVLPPLVEMRYKWPNDVLLNNRKVAGILIETEGVGKDALDWLVIGVGLNIASHPEDTEFPATGLKFEAGVDFTAQELLETFTRHFLAWVNRWLDDGFEPVRQEWRRRAKGINEKIAVRLPDGRVAGTFIDLDTDGALILETDAGRRRITAGDVFFAAP
ncbi:MAG: biotin--[acetyl-CoA-carboxylase] ligase [Rhodospirillales bacterium]|nr:biotin--[acetyl-CoA-carboxylase] ligase [Rhodospirillales bacterium]